MTNERQFSIIVAIDSEGGIGRAGLIPWNVPSEIRHFINMTTDGAVIMGRKTWDSIPEEFRPLPRRTNIVLSRNLSSPPAPGVLVAASLQDAINICSDMDKIWVIGGATVFAEALLSPRCEQLVVARIHGIYDCDTFFPKLPLDTFERGLVIDRDTWHVEFFRRITASCR